MSLRNEKRVQGFCGTCGLGTDKLPCPHCELVKRAAIQAALAALEDAP